MLVDGSQYSGGFGLLDSVNDRLVAEGALGSLLDIDIKTGKVTSIPLKGKLDSLSIDGNYVLYRKMLSDSQVGDELAAYDFSTGKSIELGKAERNYVFGQGVK